MAKKQFNSVDGYSVGPNASISIVDANGNVTANTLSSNGNVSFSGPNVDLGSVSNLHITGGATGQFLQTDGAGNVTWNTLTGGPSIANGTSNVNIPSANGNVNISAVGNANVVVVTGTGANITGTLGVSGNANVGNLGAAQVLATANITAPQLISNVAQGTAPLVVTSNTVVTNLNADLLDGYNTATAATASTIVARDANGNVTANFYIGNGSQLTGITASQVTGITSIANGNSNVNIPSANGNVNISAIGNANVVVITGTGINVAGTLNATGNANVGNIGATAGVLTANLTAGNVYANSGTIGASLLTGTLTTAAQPNITSVGTLSSLVVSGNATVGNVRLNGGLSSNRSNVAISGATVIDQFAPATFRTAKYVISASGDNGYQSVETLLVHDGVNAYITIYGSICSNVSSDIIDVTANINGVSGNVSLYAANTGANVKVNIVSSYIQI